MRRPAAALALLLLVGAGCGGDDDVDDSTTFPPLTVDGTEMAFSPSTFSLEQGTHAFVLDNKGQVVHELAIRESDGKFLGRVSAKPGEKSPALEVDLDDGEYEMVCQEPGHLEAGMRADLEVN